MADEAKSAWDTLGEFLFGKSALDKAAGKTKKPPAPSAGDYAAAKKRADEYAEQVKTGKAGITTGAPSAPKGAAGPVTKDPGVDELGSPTRSVVKK